MPDKSTPTPRPGGNPGPGLGAPRRQAPCITPGSPPKEAPHDTQAPTPAVPEGSPRAPYVAGDARISPRQAPQDLRRQAERARQEHRIREDDPGGHRAL